MSESNRQSPGCLLDEAAELLVTAILRANRTAEPLPIVSSETPIAFRPDAGDQEILRFLQATEDGAEPRTLALLLEIPLRTLSRRLQRLIGAGLCERTGKTRSTIYRIRRDYSAN
jgi:hypothetical protein